MAIKKYGRNFTAIDVELANDDLGSICEVGLAKFRAGELVETWRALVNPEGPYQELYHSDLHGIRHQHTSEAPKFPEVYFVLKRFMEEEVCIFHGASSFDQACIARACERYQLSDITDDPEWVSTFDLARDYWPDEPSYKLENLCRKIGHDYLPHNALEDAIASAAVFRAVCGLTRVPAIVAAGTAGDRPRTFRRVASRRHETGLKGNADGPFAGTHIVVTGNLAPPWDDRGAFERYLCTLGFVPRGSISGKTKILVAGDAPGTSKVKKAAHQGIQIMGEKEFLRYIDIGTET
jgi:DNA polymerase-3 subunit epsilon